MYIQYRVDKSLPQTRIGNQMNTNRTFTPYLFNVRLNIILPSMPESCKWFLPFQVSRFKLSISQAYYRIVLSEPLPFYRLNNT
jgi:hypothetical protein